MTEYTSAPSGLLSLVTLPAITWRDRLLWRLDTWLPVVARGLVLAVLFYALMHGCALPSGPSTVPA